MNPDHPKYVEKTVAENLAIGPESHPVYKVHHCRSTMDLAMDWIEQGRFPLWASVLADTQTAGRGQLGRTWHSPSGNVYGSLRLPLPGRDWRELVPLVIAQALVNMLTGFGLSPAVKWPNDILIQGKKTAGILVEERAGSLIAGIGINLVRAPDEGALHHPLSTRACHLKDFGVSVTPMEIWIALVRLIRLGFEPALRGKHPQTFINQLIPRMAYVGERVLADAYEGAGQPVIVNKIDIRGGLIVQTSQGERTIRSGSLYPLA